MSVFEIPLISMPQKLEISLAGVTYNLVVRWIESSQFWILDINDQNNVPIIDGIPLVLGLDLLGQYEYLNLGGSLVVKSDVDANAPPTSANLGSQSHLLFVTAS